MKVIFSKIRRPNSLFGDVNCNLDLDFLNDLYRHQHFKSFNKENFVFAFYDGMQDFLNETNSKLKLQLAHRKFKLNLTLTVCHSIPTSI